MHPLPDSLAATRAALVIATSTYDDSSFSRLRAPAEDATDFAEVLGEAQIGGFAVTSMINKTESQVRRAIATFLSDREANDFVLIYLSCHGVLDRRGRLFFVVTDTLKSQLSATAVESAWLLDLLDECRARRQILILDCCFSGSFAEGSKGGLDLKDRLMGHGRGRTVLTASRAREYSFEGEPLPESPTGGSIFTTGLIEGLRTGAADSDSDGYISLDEAYKYAYDYVQARRDDQTPQRWLYGGEGTVILARNPKVSTSLSSVEGAVTLTVRYDPAEPSYRFEFREYGSPGEVMVQRLAHSLEDRFDQLIADVRYMVPASTPYTARDREHLVKVGASLWQELMPRKLRELFWACQHRIKQLVIISDESSVPWELLYPMDSDHNAGFLVEQFPVIRRITDSSPASTLQLEPAAIVVSGTSSDFRAEVETLQQMINPSSPTFIISTLAPLLQLIQRGNFGLLHFACHNRYDPRRGSSIELEQEPFDSMLMTASINDQTLAASKPLVFINSSKSADWARLFMKAGAGASIGTLNDVSDRGAERFALELYRELLTGTSLGKATMRARQALDVRFGDPSWLAYVVYGDANAKIAHHELP